MKRSALWLAHGLAAALAVVCAASSDAQSPKAPPRALDDASRDRLAHALDAKHAGDRERALALVGQVLADAPDCVDALWLRAWLHAESGRTALAAADFGRFAALRPDSERVLQAQAALRRLLPLPPARPPVPTVAAPPPTKPAPEPPQPPPESPKPTPEPPKPIPESPKPTPESPKPTPEPPKPTPEPPKPVAAASRLSPAPEPTAVPGPAFGSEPALVAAPDFGALYQQGEVSMRMRRYAEAVPLFVRVAQEAPDHGGAAACGKLARACLLSGQSRKALEVLAPLQECWEMNGFVRHQYALCQYAIAHAEGLDLAGVPEVVASAFARSEKEYPADAPQVQKVAQRIFAGRSSDRERARAAYDYVRTHTRYDKGLIPLGRQSVLMTLSSGRAVCTGFAQLYITLCRAGGVPARLVSGSGDVGFHNWTEVWLVGKGWVPVDPSRASTRGRNTFGRLDDDLHAYPNQRENW